MVMMPPRLSVHAAGEADRSRIDRLILSTGYTHRHLDWREPLDWLGYSPFFLLEKNQDLVAALACPPEPEEAAWIRLFALSDRITPERAFTPLLEATLAALAADPHHPKLASIAIKDWYQALLIRMGFELYQHIIMMRFSGSTPPPRPLSARISLRPMRATDADAVVRVDHLAFEPLWQLSTQDILNAYRTSGCASVALWDDEIIGYQITSCSGAFAHMSRLAVHPAHRQQNVGFALVHLMLQEVMEEGGAWEVSLNTQHTNLPSQALYRSLGFVVTGDQFPLYVYPQS